MGSDLKLFIFIFFILEGHLWGHCCHCFGLLVTSVLGFKASAGPSLMCFLRIPIPPPQKK